MAYYTISVEGTDILAANGATLSQFANALPEPKVMKVEIPAGADLDITESVGRVAFHNGTHTFKVLVAAETETAKDEAVRRIVTRLHGKRRQYQLSWDEGYTYTGRFEVSVERLSPLASMLTITSDRYPWKLSEELTADIDSHPVGTHTLLGSERYSGVAIKVRQAATVLVGSGIPFTFNAAGTYDLYAQLYGDNLVTVTVSDWWQYLDGTNLVVNPDRITISGNDAQFGSDWVLDGTDLYCANEAKQHSTLYYTRKDL